MENPRILVTRNESWKNGDSEWQSRTEWHSVVAEHANNIAKGTHLMVQGSLRSRGYEKDVLLNLSPAHNDYKGLNVKRKAVVWLGSRGPAEPTNDKVFVCSIAERLSLLKRWARQQSLDSRSETVGSAVAVEESRVCAPLQVSYYNCRAMKYKFVSLTAFVLALTSANLLAQARGEAPQPPQTPRAMAPLDLTGYWVSIVTEDWRFRMVTPPKGDFASVPLNQEGIRVGNQWDPAKDEAAGEQCKSYGAPAIMRVPGRVHITWENDTTLKAEMDAGQQTRLFHFGEFQPPATPRTWQGNSVASWETAGGGRGRGAPSGGSLKVVTSGMRAGYLRKNGAPYSEKAVVTEYYDRTTEPNGDTWLIVTTVVHDPTYLNQEFITSTHFRKQADAAGWNPQPCTAK